MVRILHENEELGRTLDRLNAVVEASKKVDIGVEDKKKGNVTIGGSVWLREKS